MQPHSACAVCVGAFHPREREGGVGGGVAAVVQGFAKGEGGCHFCDGDEAEVAGGEYGRGERAEEAGGFAGG